MLVVINNSAPWRLDTHGWHSEREPSLAALRARRGTFFNNSKHGRASHPDLTTESRRAALSAPEPRIVRIEKDSVLLYCFSPGGDVLVYWPGYDANVH